jgi:phosphoglycerate dehydrogenase-like enzyme
VETRPLANGAMIGKRITDLGRALGMKVLVSARKTPSTIHSPIVDSDRVPFDDVLKQATVLVLSLPRIPETLNLISTAELQAMHQYAVLINIARGGIVDEAAVVQALKDKQIAGYATDVFEVEPIGGPDDTPLLAEDAQDLNITMSPHLAWFSQRTLKNLGDILKETVESWAKGKEINVIV